MSDHQSATATLARTYFRPDLRASAGLYRIWVLGGDGRPRMVGRQYESDRHAISAIEGLVRLGEIGGDDRVLIYDDVGWLKYSLPSRK